MLDPLYIPPAKIDPTPQYPHASIVIQLLPVCTQQTGPRSARRKQIHKRIQWLGVLKYFGYPCLDLLGLGGKCKFGDRL